MKHVGEFEGPMTELEKKSNYNIKKNASKPLANATWLLINTQQIHHNQKIYNTLYFY